MRRGHRVHERPTYDAAHTAQIEVRTCQAPNLTSAPNSPNPAWAVPDAERVARAMLQNVGP